MPVASGLSGQLGMAEELYTNEVQSISGTPSGVFGLTFDGAGTITTLAITESAVNIQNALNALPNVGTAGVVCAGGPLPTAVTVTYSGALVQRRNVPLLTVQGAITGLVFGTTTPGTGYGDPVTTSRFLEFIDETVALTIDRLETKSLRATNRVQRTDRWAPGKRDVSGDINLELQSKGCSMLLGHMLGSAPVITTPAGGATSRDHTIVPGDETGRSLTVQIGVPDSTGTVQPYTYTGVKITDWEFALQPDGLLLVKAVVDAQNESTAIGLSAASYASALEMLYWTQGQATIAGANVDIRDFKLMGKQTYNTGRFFLRSGATAGGPNLKKEPIANGYMEITGEMLLDFDSLVHYNRFVNGATAAVTLLIEGSAIEAITGGTARYGLQLTLPFCRFDGSSADVKNMDVTDQPLKFKALWDGTTAPLTLRYRTTDTAV